MLSRVMVVLCLLGFASQGIAQSQQNKAKEINKKAIGLFQEGKVDEAIRLFEEAYRLDPDPVYLRNMGRAYEKKGELFKAKELYQKSLEQEKDPEQRAKTQAYLEALLERLPGRLVFDVNPRGAVVKVDGKEVETSKPLELRRGSHLIEAEMPGYGKYSDRVEVLGGVEHTISIILKPMPGKLRIECGVEGAKVLVDGTPVGTTPLPKALELPQGRHVVDVTKEGFERWQNVVEIKPGKEEGVGVNLVPKNVSVPPKPGEPIGGGTPTVPKKVEVKKSPWPWALLGGGALFIVTGGVMTGLAKSEAGKVETTNVPGLGDVVTIPQSEAESHRDKAKTYEKVSYAMYGLGGAAIVTSVVLFLVKPGSNPKTESPNIVLTPVAYDGQATMAVQGRF